MLANHRAKLVKNRREALGERIAGRKLDATETKAIQFFAAIQLDHTVTGAFGATVNTEDAHLQQFTRWRQTTTAETSRECRKEHHLA
jgi:hypothetical protein